MKISFFIQEDLAELLNSIMSNYDVVEKATDYVYASNYVPRGSGDRCSLGYREIKTLHELRASQSYIVSDEMSSADMYFIQNGGMVFITSWSGFKYTFETTDVLTPCQGGQRYMVKVTYEGAWNGLLAQNILPSITPIEDDNDEVTTSKGVVMTRKAYETIRKFQTA